MKVEFGTRLFNAGQAHDPVHVMRVGKHKALALGFGTPADVEDLVVVRDRRGNVEPFDVQAIHNTVNLDGFPQIWIAHIQSLLRLNKKS